MMLQFIKRLTSDFTSLTTCNIRNKTSRNIFRLASVLCIVFLIIPPQFNYKEHGIGGGNFSEEVFTEGETNLFPASFETEMVEPDSLSKTRILLYNSHIVSSGDNISTLAINYGLNQDTIISLNKIINTRLLQVGKVLKIPNQDGIFHSVRSGEDLTSLSERYSADQEAIKTANELFSDNIAAGTDLFIPGARLSWEILQEINGDLFIWPVNGAITSSYGWRTNPFNRSQRQFHNGIDLRGSTGTPVRAAMAGRVSATGVDNVFGKYIIISHHSGYRTLYGHLDQIRTRTGAYVAQGERIGDVGSTGQSTGAHLHFTVYKNGVTTNPRALIR